MLASLQLTDGTETAVLSGGTGTFLGATYAPRPSDGTSIVVEEATVTLEGTAANVLLDTQKVERLLALARSAPANVKVYVQFQRTGDARVWRARVRDGRLIWSDNSVLRRLNTTATSVSVVVAWERDGLWECATAQSLGTKPLFNGDGAGTDPDGYVVATVGGDAYNAVEFAAVNIEGTHAAPAHLILKNNDGAAASLERVYFANDVFGRFEGGEHLVSGATLSWGNNSTHGLPIYQYRTLTADQVAGIVAAGGVRLLAVFSDLPSGIYLRAWLLQKQGSAVIYSTAWTGPEVLTDGRKVIDLGFCPAPPNVRTFSGWYLAFSVYASVADTAELEFVQLCPGPDLLLLEITDIDPWADDSTIEWWGADRYAELNAWHGEVRATGRLMLQPQRANRIMTLVEGANGVDNTLALTLTAKMNALRATV